MVRKRGLFWASAFTIVTVGSAAGGDVEYLGNTPATLKTSGNQGIVRYQQLCESAFPGLNARMCTSEEIIRNAGAVPKADVDSYFQWVHPSIVATAGSMAVDFSGIQATPNNLSCNGWTSAAATVTGLQIGNLGAFSLGTCNVSREITCCAALPDTVP